MLADIVKTQEQPNQVSRIGYYNKSMEIIHEQYNQILQMLGKTNLQGTSDVGTCTQGPISGSVNQIQSSNTARNSFKISVGSHDWIVDSGATNHITYKSDMLFDKKSMPSNSYNQVYLPNGDKTTVSHTWSCNINEHERVEDVLVIPKFKNNLLSLSKITKSRNCSVSFFPDFFVFRDLYNGQVKVIGKNLMEVIFSLLQNQGKS